MKPLSIAIVAFMAASSDRALWHHDPDVSADRDALAHDRPAPRRTRQGGRRHPRSTQLFFIGVHNGGVWKTTDYGRTWTPIFDDQPTGSIGAIAIAPSNPDIIYVGSGEGLQRPDLSTGDGIYKSTDGGKTWTHLGLRDGQQIPQIIVDPRNPDRLFVAVLGHPYGPNAERGIFRSTDGGRSFEKVLYKDENTGAADVAFDPSNPRHRLCGAVGIAPGAVGERRLHRARAAVSTSRPTAAPPGRPIGNGLPTGARRPRPHRHRHVRRASRRASSPSSRRPRSSAASIDPTTPARAGGASTTTTALVGPRRDFREVKVDPKNRDVVYVGNIVAWKSTDGGKTFTAFRGAPGGDDYHRIWINPKNPTSSS